MSGYIPRWYTRPKTVTHPCTNRARRGLTSFMRRTPLTTTTPRRISRHPRVTRSESELLFDIPEKNSNSFHSNYLNARKYKLTYKLQNACERVQDAFGLSYCKLSSSPVSELTQPADAGRSRIYGIAIIASPGSAAIRTLHRQ